MDAREVQHIFAGSILGDSSTTPTSNAFRGLGVDDNIENTKRRCV
jgi:hypothetical protein